MTQRIQVFVLDTQWHSWVGMQVRQPWQGTFEIVDEAKMKEGVQLMARPLPSIWWFSRRAVITDVMAPSWT
jgi:hypothetical protein